VLPKLDPAEGDVTMEVAAIDGPDPGARTFRMACDARHHFTSACLLKAASVILAVIIPTTTASADTILLKNGTAIRGTLDQDNTLAFVSDNLKRTIFYNSKIAKVESDTGVSKFERFALVQPMEVHVGTQPPAAASIQSTPWDAKGRRRFRYVNNKAKTVEMQQAINELTPQMTRFRGIDGFWQGQVATSQVPRPVILGLLKLVNQNDQDERLKITRWMIQAEWYPEALTALDGLLKDFPDEPGMKERVADTRRLVFELQARQSLEEIRVRRKANQPLEVLARLKAIPLDGLPKDIVDEIRDQIRKDDDQAVADRQLADSLRDLADKLSEGEKKAWKVRLAEVMEVVSKAPDAARARLEPFAKADPALPVESRFALAMSSWVLGADLASDQLPKANDLWHAREVVRDYLGSRSEAARSTLLADLRKIEGLDHDTIAKLVVRMDPPRRDPDNEKPGVVTLHRVSEDDNEIPSEYALLLPPEYNPARSYPAVIALHHENQGLKEATEWLATEAARRGYIVITPEYNVPGQGRAYHFSTGEHAAAELSLRDARKRYSIDSDRVFVAGQLEGGYMALDFGLGHPDLFAGVVCVSGFPIKYAYSYKKQVEDLPLYVVLGEMAPAAREVAFDQYFKPMILDAKKDVTYVDYLKRGMEELPEEVPSFFDWMDHRRREPVPKSFEAASARDSDARFFGVVVRDFAPGRTTAPEAADPFGKNLRPATIEMKTSAQGNLINLTTTGINRLDVWVSPRLIDFKKKMEVRLNSKPLFKGQAKLEYDAMLEDLRIRGDRQQIYYMKVVMGMGNNLPRTKGR
jgi:dienelactone hydrolase